MVQAFGDTCTSGTKIKQNIRMLGEPIEIPFLRLFRDENIVQARSYSAYACGLLFILGAVGGRDKIYTNFERLLYGQENYWWRISTDSGTYVSLASPAHK